MAKGDGGMGRFANAAQRGGNAIGTMRGQPSGLGGFNPNFGRNMPGRAPMMNPNLGGMFNPSGNFGQLDVMPKQSPDQQQPISMGPSGIGAGLRNRGIFGGGFTGGIGNKFGFGGGRY